MSYYELLNEYVDGGLQPDQEQELFAALNGSDELRSQLKHIIAVNMAAKSPKMQSRPSDETTRALFSNLGIAVLPDGVEAETTGSITKDKEKRRYLPLITSIAASLLLLFLLTYSIDMGINDKTNNDIKYTANNTPATKNKRDIPLIDSYSNGNKTVVAPVTRNGEAQYAGINRNNRENTVSNESKDRLVAESSISLGSNLNSNASEAVGNTLVMRQMELKTMNHGTLDQTQPDNSFRQLPVVNNENPVKQEEYKTLGLTVEVRGSTNWMAPEPNIEPKKKALFNNNSLALMYSLTDELALGAEVRQENFFQKYQGFDTFLGSESIYEQQPNFTSGGVFGRYTNKTISFINPFVQVTGGANETGLLARSMAGLVIKPATNVSLIIGYEYSCLFYNYQNVSYNSEKTTLHYGMSFTF